MIPCVIVASVRFDLCLLVKMVEASDMVGGVTPQQCRKQVDISEHLSVAFYNIDVYNQNKGFH